MNYWVVDTGERVRQPVFGNQIRCRPDLTGFSELRELGLVGFHASADGRLLLSGFRSR